MQATLVLKAVHYRGVVPGGAMAPASPDFGLSVNPEPYLNHGGGGGLCPPNDTGTPRFSDLPTALHYTTYKDFSNLTNHTEYEKFAI